MRIFVDRFTSDNATTISRIFVNGQYTCFGLEDRFKAKKIVGKTRIPQGTYKVGVRTIGGFHSRYKRKFPDIHKGMLHILDIPNFEYVLIHIGNWAKDTSGCLLVGDGAVTTPGNMMITQSTQAYRQFYPKVIDAAIMGRLNITIQDHDIIQEVA